MKQSDGSIVSIQVAPFKTYNTDGTDHYEIQIQGADVDTKGYAVYRRFESGQVEHITDRQYEADAVRFAKDEAARHGVSVELYAWQEMSLDDALDMAIRISRRHGVRRV